MVTLLAVAVIIVALVYGARIGNDNSEHDSDTKTCIAVICHMDSAGSGIGFALHHQPVYPPRDRPEEY